MEIEEVSDNTLRGHSKAWKYIVGLVVFLILVGLIAVVLWLVSLERAATAPIRTSDAFIKNLLDKNPKAAYALTHDEFRQKTSEEDMAQVSETVSSGLKLETLKVSKGELEEVDRGKIATVYYEIDGKDAKYEIKVRLLKEKDSAWLIVSADNAPKK